MVKINGVENGSPAMLAGISKDEYVVSVNGFEITDVLDYRFYCADVRLVMEISDGARTREVVINKEEYADIGLEFDTYLMDAQRSCKNNCIFCFIDQLPDGMRDTLYFKDDDSRLSFLFGNYITLTNISHSEIERIIKMRISPINISVHTTNPQLRCKMMNNRFAGEKLKYIGELAEAGIKINAQLVLCPEINDGDELRRSIRFLADLYPSVESVAAVPAGITKHRQGLYPIKPYTPKRAGEVIDIIDEYGAAFFDKHGTRLVYPADEFFNIAGREMPSEQYYGDFLQLENGVGMSALLKAEFEAAAADCDCISPAGGQKTIITGTAAFPLIKSLVDCARKKWHNINCEVVCARNRFFGDTITAVGLLTGQDIVRCIKEKGISGTVLISSSTLRSQGDIFLDDMSPRQVTGQTGCTVKIVNNDGGSLLEALLE